MRAIAVRWRWMAACAVAGVLPLAVPRGAPEVIGPIALGLSLGLGEAIALGGERGRRLRWFALTAVGTSLAVVVGYVSGIAAFLIVAFPAGFVGLRGDTPATIALGIALIVGGAAAGGFVGALQAGMVRDGRAWISRSARAGVFMLPAAATAVLWPSTTSDAVTPTFFALVVADLAGGAICGYITAGDPSVTG